MVLAWETMEAAGTIKESRGEKEEKQKENGKEKERERKERRKEEKGKGEKGKGKGKGPKGGCFHCGGPHYARDCPKRAKVQVSNTLLTGW